MVDMLTKQKKPWTKKNACRIQPAGVFYFEAHKGSSLRLTYAVAFDTQSL